MRICCIYIYVILILTITRIIYSYIYTYNHLYFKKDLHLYALRDDTSIIIKETDKNSRNVICGREDNLVEARAQIEDK